MVVAVVIKDKERQYEGLRICIAGLLDGLDMMMFVLEHEIDSMDEAYTDNIDFMDEMGGKRFSNNSANVEKHGFTHATLKETASMLRDADLVIPF